MIKQIILVGVFIAGAIWECILFLTTLMSDSASLTARKTTLIRHIKAINNYPILLQYVLAPSSPRGIFTPSPSRNRT